MSIELHIERLVLDGFGFARHEADAIGGAVQSELTRLLSAHGSTLSSSTAIASLRGAPVTHHAGSKASGLGESVARSVWGGLTAREVP